mmetsp:Transcript_25160/g.50431  ORF Transcript_25160/g.50431 Transcript_25160/m.50431 type:complete len:234 (-) Transcript_25160:83-784(-)
MALCRRYAGWNWLRSNHWQPIRDGRAVFGRSALLLLHDNVFHRFHSGRCRRRHLGGNLVLVVEALGLLVPALERLAGPLRDLVLLVHVLGAVERRHTRALCLLRHFVLLIEIFGLPTSCDHSTTRRPSSISYLAIFCRGICDARSTNDGEHHPSQHVPNTASSTSCPPHCSGLRNLFTLFFVLLFFFLIFHSPLQILLHRVVNELVNVILFLVGASICYRWSGEIPILVATRG